MGSVNSARKKVLFPNPVVDTEYGQVEGRKVYIHGDQIGNIFLGIPFAKPPVGDLRFQKPEPPDKWTDTLHCKNYRSISVQKQIPFSGYKSGEDCLYLNVVTPNWTCDNPDGFPVMFYIHGGGYVMDSGVNYNYKKVGRLLVRHGVIVVTICYRLGLLGYFCTSDDTAKGNYGLWDQYLSLKFVYDNIKNFGGDPNNITVFGQSAGAVSCDLLAMSPLSRHMVNKVALMGGNCETLWGVGTREFASSSCRTFAAKFGFKRRGREETWSKADNEDMVEYLKGVSAGRLGLTMLNASEIYENMMLQVMPIVDGEIIPIPPYLLRQQSPPRHILCGNTAHEGNIFLALGRKKINKSLVPELEGKFVSMKKVIEDVFENQPLTSLEHARKVYGITDLSLNDKNFRKKVVVQILDDNVNNFALFNFCKSEREKGSTIWCYFFEHHNPRMMGGINAFLPISSATHCTELQYLFNVNMFLMPFRKTKEDLIVTDIFTRIFTNFAKYGNPNGENKDKVLPFTWESQTAEYPERYVKILAEPVQLDQFESQRHEALMEVFSNLNKYFCNPELYKMCDVAHL